MPSLQSNILTIYKAYVIDPDSDNREQYAAYSINRNLATVLLALDLYSRAMEDKDAPGYSVIPPKVVVAAWEEYNPLSTDTESISTFGSAMAFISRYVEAEYSDGSWDVMSISVFTVPPGQKDTYAP